MTKVTRVYEVDEKELEEAYHTVGLLLMKLFGTDESGDLNVEFKLIDRQRTYGLPYVAQPYSHKDPEGAYRIALLNLSIATGEANTQASLRQHDKQLMQECCEAFADKLIMEGSCTQCGCRLARVPDQSGSLHGEVIKCQYHWYVDRRAE